MDAARQPKQAQRPDPAFDHLRHAKTRRVSDPQAVHGGAQPFRHRAIGPPLDEGRVHGQSVPVAAQRRVARDLHGTERDGKGLITP